MKRIDLDIAQLQELDYSESQNLNGGFFGLGKVVIGITIAAAAAVINDWQCFKDGLAGRPASHQK